MIPKKADHRNIENILLTFLTACILASLYCYANAILNIIKYNNIFLKNDDRTYYYFSYYLLTEPLNLHPIYLSLFCNLGLVIAWRTPLITKPVVKIVTIVYLALFIFLIAAKIGIISLVILFLILSFHSSKKLRMNYLTIVGIFVFSIVGIIKLPFLRDRFFESTKFDYSEPFGHKWNSISLRLAIWSCAIDAIRGSPILGYGTGRGQIALESIYTDKRFEWGLIESYNPHSEFFSTYLDLGLLGTLALLATLLYPLISGLKSGNIYEICFSIAILLFFSVETILLRQKGIVFFSFFYSLFSWNMGSDGKSQIYFVK